MINTQEESVGQHLLKILRLPQYLSGKEPACNSGAAGHVGSILGLEDPLEKEMAIHCNILAWRIQWTEEPGRLQSMGHKSQTQLNTHTYSEFSADIFHVGGAASVVWESPWSMGSPGLKRSLRDVGRGRVL